jgi:two-component system response regulator PilR (NtrC family)
VAPFDSHIFIIGESGSGKELVAKALHDRSHRALKRLVAINCASLPSELLESELFGYARGAFTGAYTSKRGLIEEANGGTLFLDEIGEMPTGLQAKLLRFLEDKKIRPLGSSKEIDVDVRVIAATNRPFKDLLEKGEFRNDLYYRLATFEMRVPSLRERREDIPILVDHFIKLYSEKFRKKIVRVDPAFMNYIIQHELRGNVRELKNIIEREVILSEDGCIRDTGAYHSASENEPVGEIPDHGMNLNHYLADIERELLHKALKKSEGVKTRAAELLGLTFREFRYRLSKYKLAGD